MKINDRMRYPHPVLSEFSSDYNTGEFSAEFSQNLTKENELKISSSIVLKSDDLRNLISEQKAALGFYVVCRRTFFNRLELASTGESVHFFDARQFFGLVQIRPVVWTLIELENYQSELINSEFGNSVPIAKGAVVAMGPEFRFSMDRRKFKPFDSIFELAKDNSLPAGRFMVDPEQERITILAEEKTFNSMASMRNMPAGRSLLLGSVYLPAVVEVVSRMQHKDNFGSYKWFRVFKGKCDDLAVDPTDETLSALKIAQQLLREPFGRTIKAAETL